MIILVVILQLQIVLFVVTMPVKGLIILFIVVAVPVIMGLFLLFLVEVVVMFRDFDQVGFLLFVDVVMVLRDFNDFRVVDGFDFGGDVNTVMHTEK